MEYTLYLDLFFMADFFFNLLALFLSAGVLGEKIIWRRLGISAAAGSLWSCALLVFPVFSVLEELILTVTAVGSLMVFLAFRTAGFQATVRAAAALLISSALLEGCLAFSVQYFYLSDWECLFFTALVSIGGERFLRLRIRRRQCGEHLYRVWLFYRGKKKEFLALADSGNRLTVPGTGKPVSVIARGDCEGFCDRVAGGFFVPYRAVGTEEGLLFAVPFEKMEIVVEGTRIMIEKPVVAVANQRLSAGNEFTMLIPECFVSEKNRIIRKERRRKSHDYKNIAAKPAEVEKDSHTPHGSHAESG